MRAVMPGPFRSVAALTGYRRTSTVGAAVSDDNWKTTGHSKHSSPLWAGWTLFLWVKGSKISPAAFFFSPLPNKLEIVRSYQAPHRSNRFETCIYWICKYVCIYIRLMYTYIYANVQLCLIENSYTWRKCQSIACRWLQEWQQVVAFCIRTVNSLQIRCLDFSSKYVSQFLILLSDDRQA